MVLDAFELFKEDRNGPNKCVLIKALPYCPVCSEKRNKALEIERNKAQEIERKKNVPLEEALNVVGTGLYTSYVMFVAGMIGFSGTTGILIMSIIIPAAQCDLSLSNNDKGTLTSMSFLGMTVSSLIFGYLADNYGRRRIAIYCSFISAAISALASLSPNSTCLMFIWFFNGIMLGGMVTTAFVFVSEFCHQKIRARSILIPASIFTLAAFYFPCIAWLILPLNFRIPLVGGVVYTPWRLFLLVATTPATLFSVFLLFLLPESPKFILNQGKETEALQILQKMYAVNHFKDSNNFPIESVCLDANDQIMQNKIGAEKVGYLNFITNFINQGIKLFQPPLLVNTVTSCLLLLGLVGPYNAFLVWYPEQLSMIMKYSDLTPMYNATLCDITNQLMKNHETQGKNCNINEELYVVTIVTALLQSFFCGIISLTADRIGRKTIIGVLTTLSGVLSILLVFWRDYLLTVITLSLMLGLLTATFPIGISIVVDYFPTSLRSTATSITVLCSRLGTAGGSQILGVLFLHSCDSAFWGMAAILLGTALLTCFMPSKGIKNK